MTYSRGSFRDDPDLITRIAAQFDLRKPNEDALRAVVARIADPEPRLLVDGVYPELVTDLATGVGKTFLMAALVEYAAQQGIRNVLVVTPGSTIQTKTIANFDAASPKYVPGADVIPVVVTPDNFRTAQTGALLRDPRRLKVFVFNVQQLTKPSLNTTRRTHTPDEVLGEALYEHLQNVDDLLVIADEHHVYRTEAAKFSAAVRDLEPVALVGLTATPDASSLSHVIFEYTLGEAIADGHVKTPVIAYRHDGTSSEDIQIGDAVELLRRKERSYARYIELAGAEPVHPVLFVVASDVAHADQVAEKLSRPDLIGGGGAVLEITNQSSDAALDALAHVEDTDSPVKAIVSVNKLREGWDVKNIAVIVGLRKLASQSLTEQILGRGLRLPFGALTGIDDVDQVDLVAHDSYQKLLDQKDVLTTRLMTPSSAVETDQTGSALSAEQTESERQAGVHRSVDQAPDLFSTDNDEAEPGQSGRAGSPSDAARDFGGRDTPEGGVDLGGLQLEDTTTRLDRHSESVPNDPVDGAPHIVFPRRDRTMIASQFSLTTITGLQARQAGSRFSVAPGALLDRTKLEGRHAEDGVVMEPVRVEEAEGHIFALELPQVIDALAEAAFKRSAVTRTRQEKGAAERIAKQFVAGAGDDEYPWDDNRVMQARAGIEGLVRDAAAGVPVVTRYHFVPVRIPEPGELVDTAHALRADRDRFVKGAWFGGWHHSIQPYARFDSASTEFEIARMLDSTRSGVDWWLRLPATGDAYIHWGETSRYFPDFIAVVGNEYWLIEGKSDRDAGTPDVMAKQVAAGDWARAVSDDGEYGKWHYVFATEQDVRLAGGSWPALLVITNPE